MSTPELHDLPVYACAAGSVSHPHAADTLEPAVLLHTFLPPAVRSEFDQGGPARVDISSDGPGAPTVTVRVLVGQQAVSWQLPLAPLVAALPGQLGDDGRMVLLAVCDHEPDAGFWARPMPCDRLAAELALPVADLSEALQGKLISWLEADLQELLHLDAHDRVSAASPAQTLADAVHAHYAGDLSASQEATRVVRALELSDHEDLVELAARLSSALATAVTSADEKAREQVRAGLGPFETEALTLLSDLPDLVVDRTADQRAEAVMTRLGEAPDRDEAVRAAVALSAALTRAVRGPDLTSAQVLAHLGMVDDAGLARLARLWVSLAVMADHSPKEDVASVHALVSALDHLGPPAVSWLVGTATRLADLAEQAGVRQRERLSEPLSVIADLRRAEHLSDPAAAVQACLDIARHLRQRHGQGPGTWLTGRSVSAVQAAGEAFGESLVAEGRPLIEVGDLIVELLADDVEGPDLLDALLCATCMLLADVDPQADPVLRQAQLGELIQQASPGAKGSRWLLDFLLREAAQHDPFAPDLAPLLPAPPPEDPDRVAGRQGRHGVMRTGLICLGALSQSLGPEARRSPIDVLGLLLASGLSNHDLLRRPAPR